jgi:hypothetical protein
VTGAHAAEHHGRQRGAPCVREHGRSPLSVSTNNNKHSDYGECKRTRKKRGRCKTQGDQRLLDSTRFDRRGRERERGREGEQKLLRPDANTSTGKLCVDEARSSRRARRRLGRGRDDNVGRHTRSLCTWDGTGPNKCCNSAAASVVEKWIKAHLMIRQQAGTEAMRCDAAGK